MAETNGFGPVIRFATPQGAVVAMQGCMTCGGVVAEELATTHAEHHDVVSGSLQALADQVLQLNRRVQDMEVGYTDHVSLHRE